MYKAAFVILHYETLIHTVECVDSIVSTIDFPGLQIVIVDNGSPNNSGNTLKEKYENNPRIYVLLNNKNLGFAQGNNKGYLFAKENLRADFIILINNDTILFQPEFITKIIERYTLKRYDILGPDILSLKDGSHQNPKKEVLDNPSVVKNYIKYFRISLLLNYFFIDNISIRIKKYFSPGSKLPSATKEIINPGNIEMEQVKLHGSAIVFSPDYIRRYEYAFYPATFLYCEESILFYFVRKDGLITVYYPDVKINHKEDATSDFLNKKAFLKRRFYLKHNIHSANVLLNLLNTHQHEL